VHDAQYNERSGSGRPTATRPNDLADRRNPHRHSLTQGMGARSQTTRPLPMSEVRIPRHTRQGRRRSRPYPQHSTRRHRHTRQRHHPLPAMPPSQNATRSRSRQTPTQPQTETRETPRTDLMGKKTDRIKDLEAALRHIESVAHQSLHTTKHSVQHGVDTLPAVTNDFALIALLARVAANRNH